MNVNDLWEKKKEEEEEEEEEKENEEWKELAREKDSKLTGSTSSPSQVVWSASTGGQ